MALLLSGDVGRILVKLRRTPRPIHLDLLTTLVLGIVACSAPGFPVMLSYNPTLNTLVRVRRNRKEGRGEKGGSTGAKMAVLVTFS